MLCVQQSFVWTKISSRRFFKLYLQQISQQSENQQKYVFMKTGIYIIARFLGESK